MTALVKEVEGWKKVYKRPFSKAKLKCMKDYVKPCFRKNDPDQVILHLGHSELNSEILRERIAKSV